MFGLNNRVGVYAEKPFVCITHIHVHIHTNHWILQNGGGHVLGRLQYFQGMVVDVDTFKDCINF